jgi:hypothetical protein
VARISCGFDRRRRHLVCSLEVPGQDERIRHVARKLEAKRVGGRHKSKGALEQIRRSVSIATRERASTCRCEAVRRTPADAVGVLVQRTELGARAVSLLEVIAENLLVFRCVVTGGAGKPVRIPLVELGTNLFGKRLVSDVA